MIRAGLYAIAALLLAVSPLALALFLGAARAGTNSEGDQRP